MKPQITEEHLVAYALGEAGDRMRDAVETYLEKDPAARRFVEETRAVAALAGEALGHEAGAGLTAGQRESVLRSARRRDADARPQPWVRPWVVLAAAAGLVVASALWLYQAGEADRIAKHAQSDMSQEAQAAKALMQRLPEGAERFLITDINNPAAAVAVRDNLDFENPQVQQQIQQLAQRQVSSTVSSEPSGRAGNQLQNELRLGRRAGRLSADPVSGPLPPGEVRGGMDYYYADINGIAEGEALSGRPQSQLVPQTGFEIRAIPDEQKFVDDPNRNYWPGHNTEDYNASVENPFLSVQDNPLSTFSIDVDTASYANVRRYLNMGSLPPKDAVRIEELINYFDYAYDPPAGEDPFASHVEVNACPWAPDHRLVRIGLKGWEMANDERPVSNLVFLIDVSGSMQPQNKLPLVRQGLRLLTEQLGENDWVSMVVYAGASGLVLPPTPGDQRERIFEAIDNLQAGGSTNGGQGIELAYKTAQEHFVKGGVNRVILMTDGDFNVGVTDQGSLIRLIEEKAKSGVFLTVLGFGMGNLNDAMLEQLADKGNGNYGYIDTLNEARKVLVEEMGGTLVTIAKDVKIQVEFNPTQVSAYRLIGYENRMLAKEDFNDDTKDAGEIGAGHTVTALYEIVPAGQAIDLPAVDPLRYQRQPAASPSFAHELLTLKLRYKQPDGDTSKLLSFPVVDGDAQWEDASPDFRFASAVAGFGLLLRDSKYKGDLTYTAVLDMAGGAIEDGASGYRREFLDLVQKAAGLAQVE